jgi:phosphoribosylaminoimidazolecarboxamide formyltransferase/IMP cyclohydrolase
MTVTPIKRALLSVSDKTGLVDLAKALTARGVTLLSTGGTSKALQDAGLEVTDVSAVTGFPEIMDGRVKTLHPLVHGALLGRTADPEHVRAMDAHGITPIDLLVVNLYPFAATLARGGDYDDLVENIDIGGPAMLRAAAKNHERVTVITAPADYADLLAELDRNNGSTDFAFRQLCAAKTYSHTAAYDSMVSRWMMREVKQDLPQQISFAGNLQQSLRYGENPHQQAAIYTDGSNRAGVVTATQIQGKELSYNNLNDTDAAYELVSEFAAPTVAIIKHANPCGVAQGDTLEQAYQLALRCDPVSAFGGIIAVNRELDEATAKAIIKVFSEVVIAPKISDAAKAVLAAKPNVRVLEAGSLPDPAGQRLMVKTLSGGLLVQSADTAIITEADLKVVTSRAPTAQEISDMLFAWRVGKHVKSNAIVYVKNGATVGIGAGQMSRLDSARIAAWKGEDAARAAGLEGNLAQGSVVASDAFFPFADGLIEAAKAGVTAVIQPGGSMRDQEVIDAANAANLAMVMTGVRHFRH